MSSEKEIDKLFSKKPSLPRAPESEELFFVYGSLMNVFKAHHLLKDAKYVGIAETIGSYRMIDCGWYPALHKILSPHLTYAKVFGECYKVNNKTKSDLDVLENEGTLYQREKIKVKLLSFSNGFKTVDAWVYFLKVTPGPGTKPVTIDLMGRYNWVVHTSAINRTKHEKKA